MFVCVCVGGWHCADMSRTCFIIFGSLSPACALKSSTVEMYEILHRELSCQVSSSALSDCYAMRCHDNIISGCKALGLKQPLMSAAAGRSEVERQIRNSSRLSRESYRAHQCCINHLRDLNPEIYLSNRTYLSTNI